MTQPASLDAFDSPIAPDIKKYFVGAEATAAERLKLFKAAADLALSSFGGRQEHYERFYGGDPFALRSQFWFNQFDWEGPARLVEQCLAAMRISDSQLTPRTVWRPYLPTVARRRLLAPGASVAASAYL